jgi:hypothetical protein
MNEEQRMKVRGSLEHTMHGHMDLHHPDTHNIDMTTRSVEDVDKKTIIKYIQNHFITMQHYYNNAGLIRDITALDYMMLNGDDIDIISLSSRVPMIENGDIAVDSPYSMRIMINRSENKQVKVAFVRKDEFKSASLDIIDLIAIVHFAKLYAEQNFGVTMQDFDDYMKKYKEAKENKNTKEDKK